MGNIWEPLYFKGLEKQIRLIKKAIATNWPFHGLDKSIYTRSKNQIPDASFKKRIISRKKRCTLDGRFLAIETDACKQKAAGNLVTQ